MIEIRQYTTASGMTPFVSWFEGLKDTNAQARIAVRLERVAAGNFGDSKLLGHGVHELRIDYGPMSRRCC